MAGSGTAHLREAGSTLLRVDHLVVEFPVGNTGLAVHAVSDVSLDVRKGETLGLVGESGCGKSTTGRAIMQVPRPTSGAVLFDGVDLTKVSGDRMRVLRQQMQMIFQDPISSLNPRRKVGDIVREPLTIRWQESFGRTAGARAWESYVRWQVRLWHQLWRWGRWSLPLLAVGTVLWIVGARAGRSASPGEELSGLASALSNLTGAARFFAVPGALIAAPFVAAFVATAAIWLVLVAAMAAMGLGRRVRMRADRGRFLTESAGKVHGVLDIVGLDADIAVGKYPHEFSGGQCQRICIARALVLDPKVIICDEPVSSLDVSVQAQILNLLEDMKERYGLTMIFIAHDLAVVKNISDRVAVMYLGKLCEVAPADTIYVSPAHPYSQALISAIPVPDPHVDQRAARVITGELPSPIAPPSGCRFRTRCPLAQDRCTQEEPQLRAVGDGHFVACHFPLVTPLEEATPAGLRASS